LLYRLCWLAWLYCLARTASPVRQGGMRNSILSIKPPAPRNTLPVGFAPLVLSHDERILLESASQLEGISTAEFLKEAGLAWAMSVLDEVGKGEHRTPRPLPFTPKNPQRR